MSNSQNPQAAVKKEIYEAVQAKFKEKGARISLQESKEFYDFLIKKTFAIATEKGYFRFPSGLGSLVVQRIGKEGSQKRLPSGVTVTVGPRDVLRYKAGTKTLAGR